MTTKPDDSNPALRGGLPRCTVDCGPARVAALVSEQVSRARFGAAPGNSPIDLVRANRPAPATRVLVVDDSPLDTALSCAVVEVLGLAVMTVADGAQAAEASREFAPDIVLMDMEMPRMNGLVATRMLRSLQRSGLLAPSRIVMLTGSGDEGTARAAREAGVDAFLAKPLSIERMREQVQHAGVGA